MRLSCCQSCPLPGGEALSCCRGRKDDRPCSQGRPRQSAEAPSPGGQGHARNCYILRESAIKCPCFPAKEQHLPSALLSSRPYSPKRGHSLERDSGQHQRKFAHTWQRPNLLFRAGNAGSCHLRGYWCGWWPGPPWVSVFRGGIKAQSWKNRDLGDFTAAQLT